MAADTTVTMAASIGVVGIMPTKQGNVFYVRKSKMGSGGAHDDLLITLSLACGFSRETSYVVQHWVWL